MMKKTLFSLVALSAIFVGCGSDKSSDPVMNDLTGEKTLEHPQNAVAVEDELDESSDGCSVGLDMTANVDPEDSRAVILNISGEKSCAPDYEAQPIADIYGGLTYSLRTRSGEVVVESLPVGSVHYGCIDLTNPSVPKMKPTSCVNLAPGEYRFTVAVEGKMAYYKFRIAGSDVDDPLQQYLEDDDSCSVGLSLNVSEDSLDAKTAVMNVVMEKLCSTDTVPQVVTDVGSLSTFGLTLRNGDVVAENLAAGQVHYGCIDLTNPSVPKMKRESCVNLAPGEYRFTITVEGKMTYYQFRIVGEIEE